ncbi:MAG: 16S rRNA (cytosine(1402)-N(4))-methyltransferase RsmH [Candidatus Cloacimonetes bacterium]|nr:16S rRNA (cytosine(1402)-N(4))-methyltransferase RsmH [Candidatus Cloacimonadota bacterium]
MSTYHTPVLAQTCTEYMQLQPGGVYVDATVGAAGHSLTFLQACPQIALYCFDRDAEAIAEAKSNLQDYQEQIHLIHSPFSGMRTQLALNKVASVDGVLFDLGVSSHQLDEAARGFSFDRDARLDMRMDDSQAYCAEDVVNDASEYELKRIFKEYGEEQQAGRIAKAILRARNDEPIRHTLQLAKIIESVAGSGTRESLKTKLRVFQALRIEVNKELEELETALNDAIMLLKPGGRVLVMSYHSLEDRIVKNRYKEAERGCVCPPRQMVCNCGLKPRVKVITKRPVIASEEEIAANPRSRGAKLRVAEKL